MSSTTSQKIHKKNADKHESDVLRFLDDLGLDDVGGGAQFMVGDRQVDACGGHEKSLIVIECTTQKTSLNAKIDRFRGSFAEIVAGFKQLPEYEKYTEFIPVFAVRDSDVTEAVLKRASVSEPLIHIWEDKHLAYYRQLQKSILNAAKYSLFYELGIAPNKREKIVVPALKVDMAEQQLFVFSIKAKQLVKLTYVARREVGAEFYQRMVNPNRLKEIGGHVDGGLVFPNSIIVNLSKRAWKFKAVENSGLALDWQTYGSLELLRNTYGACWIIDGQHRLYGNLHAEKPGTVLVCAFADLDERMQARYFIDINKEAKKVDVNLIWDLVGSNDPSSEEGIVSNSVKYLRSINGGYFEGNIKIPSLGKGEYNFNGLCHSIMKRTDLSADRISGSNRTKLNPYFDENHVKFANKLGKGVDQYFTILGEQLSSFTKDSLRGSDGFVAFMIMVLYRILVYKSQISVKKLTELLKLIGKFFNQMDEDDLNELKNRVGNDGGKTEVMQELVSFMQNSHPGFGAGVAMPGVTLVQKIKQLEHDMNKLVNAVFTKKYGDDWFEKSDVITDDTVRDRAKSHAEKHGNPPWDHLNWNWTIQNLVCKKGWIMFFERLFEEEGLGTRQLVNAYAAELWEYRSMKDAHIHSGAYMAPASHKIVLEAFTKQFANIIRKGLKELEVD